MLTTDNHVIALFTVLLGLRLSVLNIGVCGDVEQAFIIGHPCSQLTSVGFL